MAQQQFLRKYVLANNPDDNPDDTKIRIRLQPLPMSMSTSLPPPPPRKPSPPSSQSNNSQSQMQQGQIASNHNDEDSSRYQSDTSKLQPRNEQSLSQSQKKRNQFWTYRHNKPKETRELATEQHEMPVLPEEALLDIALQAANRTNVRVLQIRKEELTREHDRSRTSNLQYLNSNNIHFKANEYPVLLTDQNGRTYLNQNNNNFTVYQSTIQNFINKNLSEQTSYLQQVAKYGNFAHHHRKRRKHHFQ